MLKNSLQYIAEAVKEILEIQKEFLLDYAGKIDELEIQIQNLKEDEDFLEDEEEMKSDDDLETEDGDYPKIYPFDTEADECLDEDDEESLGSSEEDFRLKQVKKLDKYIALMNKIIN